MSKPAFISSFVPNPLLHPLTARALLSKPSLTGSSFIPSTPKYRSVINRNILSSSTVVPKNTNTISMAANEWGKGASQDELDVVLPKLYVYDHCPYCVRVRMIFGYKSIPFELAFLLNDDKRTPTRLIGKKVLPILQIGDQVFVESMDIVRKIDHDPQYGKAPVLADLAGDRGEKIKAWMDDVQTLMRKLVRPRTLMAGLPEFATKSSRNAFINNHPYKDGSTYEENFNNSDALIKELNTKIAILDEFIASENAIGDNGFSYDDIDIFPRLRNLSLIKGANVPPKTRAYIDNIADKCDIPVWWHIAI